MTELIDYDGAWKESLERHEFKWALTRRLHERGYEWQDILELFRLLDWLLVLPDELEVAFRRKLTDYEEKQNMPHITGIERLSRQEGRQEGRRLTLRAAGVHARTSTAQSLQRPRGLGTLETLDAGNLA